jgi:hypothetical protein
LSNSSESVIALFDSVAVAETAARRIEAWTGSSSHGRLESLGVLVKADNGAISLRKLGPRETRNGAAVGLVAGALSACATEGLSMVRGLVAGAAGGGAVGWLFRKNLRLSATTRSRIGVRLRPGGAAVLAVVPVRDAAAVTEKLMEYGGVPGDGGAARVPEPAVATEPAPSRG